MRNPLLWVPLLFSSVDPILSNFAKKIPAKNPYFSDLYACGNSRFKTIFKTKTTEYSCYEQSQKT